MMSKEEMKKLLEEKRDQLLNRVKAIENDRTRAHGPLDPDFEEQATELENQEVLDSLGELERKELAKIQKAIARVDTDEFGFCGECGDEISDKRLKALPYAELCLSCANDLQN